MNNSSSSNSAPINRKKGHIDWFILLPIVALMSFSVAFVYSASSPIATIKFNDPEKLFFKHAIMVLLGFVNIIVFARIDYHKLRKFSKSLLFLSIILLTVVLFVGFSTKGAARWLSIGPLSFQPSELAKFAIVIHFALLLASKQSKMADFKKGFMPFVFWLGLVCFLIALQPNFSTMLIIVMISTAMMFIGNLHFKYLLLMLVVGLLSAGTYFFSAQYRVNRLYSYLGMADTTQNVENVSYQLDQALIAIGNGGLTGVGTGQSRQSHLFLPESYGDFIYAIIGEEFGFIGLSMVLICFLIVIWRGIIVAKKAPDLYGFFLAMGIVITFAIYVFVNAGVNTGLLPTTGVPLPFISFGGTAVLIYAGAVGILLNISAQAGVYPKQNNKLDATSNSLNSSDVLIENNTNSDDEINKDNDED